MKVGDLVRPSQASRSDGRPRENGFRADWVGLLVAKCGNKPPFGPAFWVQWAGGKTGPVHWQQEELELISEA